jgi:hypothetical protein
LRQTRNAIGTDRDGEQVGERPVHEHGGDHGRLVAAGGHERGGEAELDDPEAAGGQRQRGDEPHEGVGGEHGCPGHLPLRDADVAEGQQEDGVQGEVARERGDGQGEPPPAQELGRRGPEPARRLRPPRDRRAAHHPQGPGGEALGHAAHPAGAGLAPEHHGEDDDGTDDGDDACTGGRHRPGGGLALEGDERERQHRQPQLGEDVPDAGDEDRERDLGPAEPPRREHRPRHADAEAGPAGDRVGDGGRGLGDDEALRGPQAGSDAMYTNV